MSDTRDYLPNIVIKEKKPLIFTGKNSSVVEAIVQKIQPTGCFSLKAIVMTSLVCHQLLLTEFRALKYRWWLTWNTLQWWTVFNGSGARERRMEHSYSVEMSLWDTLCGWPSVSQPGARRWASSNRNMSVHLQPLSAFEIWNKFRVRKSSSICD